MKTSPISSLGYGKPKATKSQGYLTHFPEHLLQTITIAVNKKQTVMFPYFGELTQFPLLEALQLGRNCIFVSIRS